MHYPIAFHNLFDIIFSLGCLVIRKFFVIFVDSNRASLQLTQLTLYMQGTSALIIVMSHIQAPCMHSVNRALHSRDSISFMYSTMS